MSQTKTAVQSVSDVSGKGNQFFTVTFDDGSEAWCWGEQFKLITKGVPQDFEFELKGKTPRIKWVGPRPVAPSVVMGRGLAPEDDPALPENETSTWEYDDSFRQLQIIRQSSIKAAAASMPRGTKVEEILNRADEIVAYVLGDPK